VTITEDLAALAPQLGLPVEGEAGAIAAQVVAALRSRRDWLVVFDNAQQPDDLIGIWPGEGGHVLITSRNRVWSGIATPIDLGEFSRAESVKLLCRRSGSKELDAAADLAQGLGDFPLALAQTAAYIDQHAMTIRDYLDCYPDPALAPALRDAAPGAAEYPTSTTRTLLLRIAQLSREHPAAGKLLLLCVFLDPDDIDLDLISAGSAGTGDVLARTLGDPLERTKAASALAAANLVTVGADCHLRVSGLVQAVARDQLDDDQAIKWARRTLKLIKAIMPAAPADHRSWPAYAALTPHIKAVVGHASNYPQLADKISPLRNLGIYFSASHQLRAARITFENALAVYESACGAKHPEFAKTLDNLGIVRWQLGDFGDARTLNERALTIFLKVYGPNHAEVARSVGNQGNIHLGLGEFGEARASFKRALAIFQTACGPEHPEVAKALQNLGISYLGLGEFGEARASFKRALAIFRTAYGPEHPKVAEALMNLSIAQRELRELGDARVSIEEALTIFQAAYSPRHLAVATALVNLCVVQRLSRDLRGAYTSMKRALAILQAAYGADHHELIETLINLGVLQREKITSYLISRALTCQSASLNPATPAVKVAALR
jgi:tetratricopeptide (TPR) repeat protein